MLEPLTIKPKGKSIVIEGVRTDGSKFRPSDWAERMCGYLANFSNRRVVYSPKLRPTVNGRSHTKCLILDLSVAKTNPDVFQCIMQFADENCLKIYEYDEALE